jgi:predicted nucleic acid-binding protein
MLLRNNPKVCKKFDIAIESGEEIVIPPLVHYEIKRGFACKSAPKRENSYNILTEQCLVGEMDEEVLERGASIYASLYSNKRTIDDVDLLIAAFCIVGEYTLITHNVKHFKVINGLKIDDWE